MDWIFLRSEEKVDLLFSDTDVRNNHKTETMTIHTNNRTILLVEVPEDAYSFEISLNHEGATGSYLWFMRQNNKQNSIEDFRVCLEKYLSEDDKLLGIISKDECSVDCSQLVEKEWDGTHHWYKNYLDENNMTKNCITSFRSLIEKATGKSWVNPLGKELGYANIQRHTDWHRLESNLLKRFAVIEVKTETK